MDTSDVDGPSEANGVYVVSRRITVDPSPVPLPAAGWMLVAGIGGLGALSRRMRG